MAEWEYRKDGAEFGPVTGKRLIALAAQGQLKPTDLVWRAGLSEWVPASRVNGLFAAPPKAAMPTATPIAPAAVGSETTTRADLRSKAQTTTIIKYDRFKDRTTLSTPELALERRARCDHLSFTAHASFDGKDLSKRDPTIFTLSVWAVDTDGDDISGNELIILVDGTRISLQLIDPDDSIAVIIDEATLRVLATAKEIEGRVNGCEFKVLPREITKITDMYRQLTQHR